MSLWPYSLRRLDPHRRALVPRTARPQKKLRPPQGRAHTVLENSSLHWTLSVSSRDVTNFAVTSLYPVDRPVGSALSGRNLLYGARFPTTSTPSKPARREQRR